MVGTGHFLFLSQIVMQAAFGVRYFMIHAQIQNDLFQEVRLTQQSNGYGVSWYLWGQ